MSDLAALAHPSVFPWIALVAGLAVGSFLNVVIHRLPAMMERDWQDQCADLRGEPRPELERFNLARPRSRCPACGNAISALENIPLLSYALLRGRCSACAAPIGLRYPVVEALAGLAGLYCASRYGFGAAAFGAMLFAWALIAASAIDMDTQLLPDAVTLPLLWTGLLLNTAGTYVDLRSAVIGAAGGYLFLWSVYWLFKFATGKEGMGFGDFKLLAAIGAWIGWQMLPLVVLLSSFIGAAVGIALIVLAKRGRGVPIPFGPYLAAAGIVGLFWGPQLTRYYVTKVL
ncbi:MAG: prepilin peptidase [Betaproteobacteria bacterium]|nr:prepilin peptidase [Betaproteobacteria bacterium]